MTANLEPLDGSASAEQASVIGWVVSWMDWTHYQIGSGQKKPPVGKKWFSDRDAAQRHKVSLRELNPSPDFLISLTPAPAPKKGKVKEKAKPGRKKGGR